ncbi:Uncharacterised protein [Stenotrophomonas maltophilia]|nr:Uncharacterised protein [Stenotrophomonas maltophilia]
MAHGSVVHACHRDVLHRLRLQRATDQWRKHHQQRRQDGELEQKALRAGQAGHPASVEPGPGLPVRRTVAGGGLSAGLRPAPAASWSNSNSNSRSKSGLPVGRRGGSGCGGRRKYVHVGSVAASMRLTPPQPDPPRLRQLPAVCWNGFGVRSVFRRKTDLTPDVFRYLTAFIHAWRGSTVSTKVDTYQQPSKSVRGGAVWAGRTVGAMDGAIKPPGMGLRRVLPAHTAPPPRKPAVAVASAFAIDSAGAGLQALLDPPHTVMVWVSDSHVGGTGHAAAWLPSSTLRRSRGSICGASTCTSSSA